MLQRRQTSNSQERLKRRLGSKRLSAISTQAGPQVNSALWA